MRITKVHLLQQGSCSKAIGYMAILIVARMRVHGFHADDGSCRVLVHRPGRPKSLWLGNVMKSSHETNSARAPGLIDCHYIIECGNKVMHGSKKAQPDTKN